MRKKLTSGDNGIMGFEQITSWSMELDSAGDFMFLREDADVEFPGKFALVRANADWLETTEEYDEDTWFILTPKDDDINNYTMNTRAPVIVKDGKIDQIIVAGGSVYQPVVVKFSAS